MESHKSVSQSLCGPSTPSQGSRLNRASLHIQHSSSSKEKSNATIEADHSSHWPTGLDKNPLAKTGKQWSRDASPGSPVKHTEPLMYPTYPRGIPLCMDTVAVKSQQISEQVVNLSRSQAGYQEYHSAVLERLAKNHSIQESVADDLIGPAFPLDDTSVARTALEVILRDQVALDQVFWLKDMARRLCDKQARLEQEMEACKLLLKRSTRAPSKKKHLPDCCS